MISVEEEMVFSVNKEDSKEDKYSVIIVDSIIGLFNM